MSMYGIWFENGQLMKVTVGRPINFRTFCKLFLFDHLELTVESTNQKYDVTKVTRVEKIPDEGNVPQYELTAAGLLRTVYT